MNVFVQYHLNAPIVELCQRTREGKDKDDGKDKDKVKDNDNDNDKETSVFFFYLWKSSHACSTYRKHSGW